jgi:sterol desaturase/sphingolipid hydroxylase (fatty acid hydroxylase superfamily)
MLLHTLLFSAGLGFCFFSLLFRPLEVVFPARPGQRFFRPAWFTDLCFFLGQNLLWTDLVVLGLGGLGRWLDGVVPLGFRHAVASQPWWLQAVEVFLASDFLIYWGHRLQHRVDWLWRFHAVHHSSEHLDWLAAYREHPLDTVYTLGLVNLPLLLVGFPVATVSYFIAFRGLWAIYIHSNVRLPIGPLRMLIGAPELHHWHHDRARDAGNYANLSPLMDLVFGTYRCPDHEPEHFGLAEPAPRTYLGHLLGPLLPRRRTRQDEQDTDSLLACGSSSLESQPGLGGQPQIRGLLGPGPQERSGLGRADPFQHLDRPHPAESLARERQRLEWRGDRVQDSLDSQLPFQ